MRLSNNSLRHRTLQLDQETMEKKQFLDCIFQGLILDCDTDDVLDLFLSFCSAVFDSRLGCSFVRGNHVRVCCGLFAFRCFTSSGFRCLTFAPGSGSRVVVLFLSFWCSLVPSAVRVVSSLFEARVLVVGKCCVFAWFSDLLRWFFFLVPRDASTLRCPPP